MEIIEPRRAIDKRSKYDPSFPRIGEALCRLGAIDRELATALGVTERTINQWKVRHPEFKAAVQAGKNVADARVVEMLFKMATGYSWDSEEILASAGQVFREPIVRHLPPSVLAAVFWLRNRMPEDWNLHNRPAPTNEADLNDEMKRDAPIFAPEPLAALSAS